MSINNYGNYEISYFLREKKKEEETFQFRQQIKRLKKIILF